MYLDCIYGIILSYDPHIYVQSVAFTSRLFGALPDFFRKLNFKNYVIKQQEMVLSSNFYLINPQMHYNKITVTYCQGFKVTINKCSPKAFRNCLPIMT